MDVFMARYRHMFHSIFAALLQHFHVCVNHSRQLNEHWKSTNWNRKDVTGRRKFGTGSYGAFVFVTFGFDHLLTKASFIQPLSVRERCFLEQFSRSGSRILHASACILLFASICGASGGRYTVEAGKDVTYLTNATANAERREGIDSSLRKYSFMSLSRSRTGIVYNSTLPPYFDGIVAQAIRLRYGSLRKRGLLFNEFTIPVGVVITGGPVVVLIYRKIFNFTVYTLPTEYDFAGPVVGIVTYAALNASFDDIPLPEANLSSPNGRIAVHVPISKPVGNKVPLCAFFGVDGSIVLRNVSSLPNVCTSATLGDVSLVLPATPPSPVPPAVPAPSASSSAKRPSAQRKTSNSWKIALVATIGAICGLALFGVLVVFGLRSLERIRIAVMEHSADHDEPLQTALIGQNRAPTAAGVRTRPTLEIDKFLAGNSQQ